MKKTIKLLFATLFIFKFCTAQVTDTLICDVSDRDSVEFANLPYFRNNAYLQTFLDSIGYPSAANRIIPTSQVRFHIPIKFWVYRNSAGVGGPDIRDLRNYIDNLNRFYNVDNPTWIGFYMKCDIGFIDDDSHLVINNDLEGMNMILQHKEPGCINIHVTNTIVGDGFGVAYRARIFGIDGIFLSRGTYTDPALFTTVVHEVGHYFELDHTHQYNNKGKCRKEAIDRNRTFPTINFCPIGTGGGNGQRICEASGDGLSDTPADPELNANNSCIFNLAGNYTNSTDPWGDHYATPPGGSVVPDTRNIMSYNGDRACRVIFTRLQIAVMLHSIVRGKTKTNRAAWEDARAIYDEYETDDNSLTARPITLPEVQERNFHQQYMGNGVWSQCDVDWIRFVAPCNINLFLATSEIPGYSSANANTRLTLFNNALTQLAQNDNISATNLFSSINWNFVAGQTYFIRVENMNSMQTGYYRIRFSGSSSAYSINGNSTLCTSSLYNVVNLPAGSTVSWSATPLGIVGIVPDALQQANLTKTAPGNIVLNADVITAACGTNITTPIVKSVRVGGYSSGDYPISGPSSACKNTTIYFNTVTLPGATNYAWTYPSGWTNASGQGTAYLAIKTNTTSGPVMVRVANACDAGGSPATKYVSVSTSCGSSFLISPNPANDNVTIVATDGEGSSLAKGSASQSKIYQVKIIDQYGNIKKQYSYSAGVSTTNISINNLLPGIYTVQGYNGTEWVSQKLIKQ